ncbi:MAG: long-chain fatty acid--CoA ligase [Candidatus Tectomicrobia bacterium]|uniref:Long-chain fatty acid--CoA ligase n=1 Tax=Tectimicrobiota bacterium TaxID=2528274 RepID=A0A938B1J9_UNCTE|nr:long-chain fatty acid--CoA ligase [Candidatus Tectomicrobia bacterium]
MAEMTLPQYLLHRAQQQPEAVAIREKQKGIWQEWTWAQYLHEVRDLALGLVALGFERGDTLAILSDNRPQVYWTMVAVQAAGGIPVPLYQDAISRELQYVLDHADAAMVLAEDQEQVDKVLDIQAQLPKVRRVIYDDPKGMRHYTDAVLVRFTAVQEQGRQLAQARPGLFDELVAAGRTDDVALMSYTSGTTGTPKGAMLSHANLTSAVAGMLQIEPYRPTDETLAYLPPAWIGDTFWSLTAALMVGFRVNCPERPETVQENIREIAPHFLVAPPRIWENLVSQVQVKMEDASLCKRLLYTLYMPFGYEVARRRMEHQPLTIWQRCMYTLGEYLVFAPLRDHLGFRRIRSAYTGGAALGPEVFLFFRALGVNLKQVYGQTESGVSCVQRDDKVALGTVGTPFPGIDIQLSPDGEVIVHGPCVFRGYYKNPEATASTLRDGWLYSGDAAFFDPNGQLVVIDRAKDVTALANGAKFAPQFIENKLKFSPYIKEAVTIGQDRPYVAVMINIDMDNVGKWAERRQVAYTTYTDLAQKPEVYGLIAREVERVNRDLEAAMRIQRYVLLHKELDADDEEVTRTRKVRRGFVAQKYSDIIAALYTDAREVPVTSVITYQDGRQATLETRLAIRNITDATVSV